MSRTPASATLFPYTTLFRSGVTVRVLIDGVGEWYSWPRASSLLRRAGVDTARFLPPRLVPPSISINLRNHHKILVVDDRVGFTGGMNISDRHLVDRENNKNTTSDVHFQLQDRKSTHL